MISVYEQNYANTILIFAILLLLCIWYYFVSVFRSLENDKAVMQYITDAGWFNHQQKKLRQSNLRFS